MVLPREIERVMEEVRLSRNYISTTLAAGKSIDFTDKGVLGRPANLFVVAAEAESEIRINRGAKIPMKRDEAIVIINALEIENVEVLSGQVKVFATIVPRWMPAMFWTRSVTVIGVADAVKDALEAYGAAKDATVKDKLPRYIVDSLGNELSDYFKSTWKPDLRLFDETIPAGVVWNLGGNMIKSVKNLTVQGTLIVSDQALLRTWGNVLVDGGKVIVQDSAQVISEVVS